MFDRDPLSDNAECIIRLIEAVVSYIVSLGWQEVEHKFCEWRRSPLVEWNSIGTLRDWLTLQMQSMSNPADEAHDSPSPGKQRWTGWNRDEEQAWAQEYSYSNWVTGSGGYSACCNAGVRNPLLKDWNRAALLRKELTGKGFQLGCAPADDAGEPASFSQAC
jgi:hypothetical protein